MHGSLPIGSCYFLLGYSAVWLFSRRSMMRCLSLLAEIGSQRNRAIRYMRFTLMVLVILGRWWHLPWQSIRDSLFSATDGSGSPLPVTALHPLPHTPWQLFPSLFPWHACFMLFAHGSMSLCWCMLSMRLYTRGVKRFRRKLKVMELQVAMMQDPKPGSSIPEFRLLIGRLSCHRNHNCSLRAK